MPGGSAGPSRSDRSDPSPRPTPSINAVPPPIPRNRARVRRELSRQKSPHHPRRALSSGAVPAGRLSGGAALPPGPIRPAPHLTDGHGPQLPAGPRLSLPDRQRSAVPARSLHRRPMRWMRDIGRLQAGRHVRLDADRDGVCARRLPAGPAPAPPPTTGGGPVGGPIGGGPTGDPFATARQACVNRTNQLRAQVGARPVSRNTAKEPCGDQAARSDGTTGSIHGAFGQCGEWGRTNARAGRVHRTRWSRHASR